MSGVHQLLLENAFARTRAYMTQPEPTCHVAFQDKSGINSLSRQKKKKQTKKKKTRKNKKKKKKKKKNVQPRQEIVFLFNCTSLLNVCSKLCYDIICSRASLIAYEIRVLQSKSRFCLFLFFLFSNAYCQ